MIKLKRSAGAQETVRTLCFASMQHAAQVADERFERLRLRSEQSCAECDSRGGTYVGEAVSFGAVSDQCPWSPASRSSDARRRPRYWPEPDDKRWLRRHISRVGITSAGLWLLGRKPILEAKMVFDLRQ